MKKIKSFLLLQTGNAKDVIELTDSNFEELVLNSEDIWLVEFFAPWCGHCKNLAPHWQSAATELKNKVKLGALDATVHQVISNRYGVSGFTRPFSGFQIQVSLLPSARDLFFVIFTTFKW